MTETEWLTATDPASMLHFLEGKVTDRKVRLFGCSCCRFHWERIESHAVRSLVEMTERYADGLIGLGVLLIADKELRGSLTDFETIVSTIATPPCSEYVAVVEYMLNEMVNTLELEEDTGIANDANREHLSRMRDIFGNPFRSVTVQPSWLTSTVLTLTPGVYQDCAFDRMPILADALQDAGCDNDDILSHCRSDAPHVRGCWVVDLLLGKK